MRSKQFITEGAEKPMTQCTDQELQKLLGKGKMNSLIKHPWFQEYRNYHHAYKHGVSSVGFTKVDVFSFFPEIHRTAEGKIRPLIMVEFTFSYGGTKVVQAYKYHRDKEPNENEKRYGPSAGWKPLGTWAKEEDLVGKAWDKHWDNKTLGVAESETYQPPSLEVGDKILKGKFKNSPAEIKGFKKDKHNQPVLKTNKGDVQLFKPRVTKLMKEEINPDILDPRFKDEQEIGDYRYTAHMQVAGYSKTPQLIVRCFDGETKVGEAQFYSAYGESLISALTSVDPLYQRQGIASTMYAYARMLGNTIEPSGHQLPDGRNMWRSWRKRGDAEHLMKEEPVDESEVGTPNAKIIYAKLKALGYKKLGSGADATVWAKDEATVIKILMPNDPSVGEAERIFLGFYEFCMAHQNVPCLPKFREVQGLHHAPFTIGNTQYRQIAMERLSHIKSGSIEEKLVWALSDLAADDTIDRWENAVSRMSWSPFWNDFPGIELDDFGTVIKKMATNPKFNSTYGILFNVMQMLFATGKINDMWWDLHTENVMQRSNGQLVIVDPWFAEK